MIKINFKNEQLILLFTFLKETSEDKPTNYIEWGEDWENIVDVFNNFSELCKGVFLELKEDYWYSIFNYLAMYITYDLQELKKKSESEFYSFSDLFIFLKNEIETQCPPEKTYSPYLFIPAKYENVAPVKKVYVDPNENPEKYLKEWII